MKSNTLGVLASQLTAQGFLFNGYRDRDLSNLIEPFQQLLRLMNVVVISANRVYRARAINLEEDVDTGKGITARDGKLIGGFDEKNSRIAPSRCCNIQRLNRAGEQVFYIAEEREIAIAEQKTSANGLLSVAEFDVVSPVNVYDFSAYSRNELYVMITDEMEKRFQDETNFSARQLYVEVQRVFTILESSEDFYNVSNKMCDIIKEEARVDGIRYWSYYKGHNLGIWRYRPEDYIFVGSQIEKAQSGLD